METGPVWTHCEREEALTTSAQVSGGAEASLCLPVYMSVLSRDLGAQEVPVRTKQNQVMEAFHTCQHIT